MRSAIFWLTPGGYRRLEKRRTVLENQHSLLHENLRRENKSQSSHDGIYSVDSDNDWSIENRLHEVNRILGHAKILSPIDDFRTAGLGSTVYLKRRGHTYKFTLVHPLEADPSIGFVSTESPLGQAVLGKRARCLVDVKTPLGINKFHVEKITREPL